MRLLDFAQMQVDLAYLLIACGLSAVASYLIGKWRKQKALQSALRHAENHRNELHVQCITLRELIDNQELDIKRYAEELQLCIEREKSTFIEKTQLESLAQSRVVLTQETYTPKSFPVPAQVALILQDELHKVQREKEAVEAKLASTEEVMRFLMTRETEKI